MAGNCLNCESKKLIYVKNIDSYKCLDCDFEYKKQYFFISHSHLDIEKVRIIRNIIEETFFYEPILFFLKCLSDDNEIQNLIEREISERIWFVYCDSENARNSMYVNKERQYVKKLVENGKKINILNIELDKFNIWDKQCYEYIKDQISFHIRKSKIFLSYCRKDARIVEPLKLRLINKGYSVFQDSMFTAGDSWFDQIKNNIKKHSYKDGLIINIISDINDSKAKQIELDYSSESNALIFNLYIKDLDLIYDVKEDKFNMIFDVLSFDLEVDRLVEKIKQI